MQCFLGSEISKVAIIGIIDICLRTKVYTQECTSGHLDLRGKGLVK